MDTIDKDPFSTCSEWKGEALASAWYEKVVIPTYGIGKAEKNPMFLENRVYQGSSGVVYPHPVIEKILDKKEDREWSAIFLENQYLKIMILPELGGRIQMAWDKTKQRHFVYYNQVIKPALVGLTGPWISGGIEFNWPQHHRPSTFEPVDHFIEENQDGSVTVWCSELERMFRTRGMAGFTLYPDKAYLEIKVKLYNRTNFPQTFLWWANPAVKVNDHFQSVFPPDVHAVFDHGKRDVSEFPVAKGSYYKVDYSPGTDISRYKNIPVPTSYMAINSKYNFVGGYEHDTRGGLLHIANHHVSPGKKQWTWGHSDFGQAWDRNLTDEDGPYIELMCGVYTDNQPDFSWLMPGEEKSFSQYFMPYRDIGVVKNATREAMVNLEFTMGEIIIKAYTTSTYQSARILLKTADTLLLEELFDFHPATSYQKTVPNLESVDPKLIKIEILTSGNRLLVEWQPEPDQQKPLPEAAKPARLPSEIESNDQLYLTALHLEQYRHATYNPCDYYREALKRDPKDTRCNNALGLWQLRRGQFKLAEEYFRTAVRAITQRNPNPIDGEAFYNLGLSQLFLGKEEAAYNSFYKSTWNAAWMENSYFQLARIAAKRGCWEEGLELIDRSLIRNWHNHKARQLKVSILRKLGRKADAMALTEASLKLDPFNFGLLFEEHLLLSNSAKYLSVLTSRMSGNIHTYIEFALDFAAAGLFDEAIELIDLGIREQEGHPVYPMAWYFKAWFSEQKGNPGDASAALQAAAIASPDYCFPHQPEAVVVLEWAKKKNPADAKAPYYLGNLWYHHRQYAEAIENFELSARLDNNFPTVHRNLALASFNKQNDPVKALAELEQAFRLDPSDARILMELDQLHKRLNFPPETRFDRLSQYPHLVDFRDDLYLEQITLLNTLGNYEKALELISSRKFHPWEGGEGKVTSQYVYSLTELGKQAIAAKRYEEAVSRLQAAFIYPDNLGEGKLFGAQENALFYWLGCAYMGLGNTILAQECWSKASNGILEPLPAIFYNDQQPDTIFYQGLAFIELNQPEKARQRFETLVNFGAQHLNDPFKLDYFAVSMPDLQIWNDDLTKRNRQNCMRLIELGREGLRQLKD